MVTTAAAASTHAALKPNVPAASFIPLKVAREVSCATLMTPTPLSTVVVGLHYDGANAAAHHFSSADQATSHRQRQGPPLCNFQNPLPLSPLGRDIPVVVCRAPGEFCPPSSCASRPAAAAGLQHQGSSRITRSGVEATARAQTLLHSTWHGIVSVRCQWLVWCADRAVDRCTLLNLTCGAWLRRDMATAGA